jgi:nickel-dependent lactate racemase
LLLAYGHETVTLPLDPACYDVIHYCPAETEEPPEQLVRRSLESPIQSLRLSQMAAGRKRVVILISDITRLSPSYIMLPALLDELNRGGISDERIQVIVSLGMHRKQTEEELRYLAGPVYDRVQIANHSAASEDCMYLGTTKLGTPVEVNRTVVQADLRIATGNVEPHRLVGVSGGVKALFPGVASGRSIEQHHSLSHIYKAVPGYSDNPLHQDLEEISAFVPIHFLLNVVVDHRRQLYGAYAGHPQSAHKAGVSTAREHFLVPVRQTYETIIVSTGGKPKDMQLYQAIKSLENAAGFAKPGGTILLIAKCEELYGNGTFQLWTETRSDREEALKQLKNKFVLGAHKLQVLDQVMKNHTVYLFSDIPKPITELLGFHYVHSLPEWCETHIASNGSKAGIMPVGSLTFPHQL